MITALLVDDEPNALKRLTAMLESFESVDVIGSVRSVAEAERFLQGRDPDVIFLDITMPGRLGVDLLASVRPRTKVVFVTARESYAVDAFKAGAVDYVLKPYDEDRLAITIERLEEIFATGQPAKPAAAEESPGTPDEEAQPGDIGEDRDQTVRIPSPRRGGFESVPYADILWIEATQNYTRMQMPGRPVAVVRRNMAEWESVLPEGQFARISRSLIVQVSRVRSTQWQSRDQMLVFFNGIDEPLPIGRTPMARLKDLLQQS
jgi:two-component system LytT family response regulator